MPKKCGLCDDEARYRVKDTLQLYCYGCAAEHFGDISYLQQLEDDARKLLNVIEEKIDGLRTND